MNDNPDNSAAFLDQSSEERSVLMYCALRFDGYKFEEYVNQTAPDGQKITISAAITPIVDSYTLHQDDNLNFLAFFGLQRFLGKWGGEYLTPYSREHLAYRFLFLQLYSKDVPEEFRKQTYYNEWNSRYAPDQETHAAIIRSTFTRIGLGEPTKT